MLDEIIRRLVTTFKPMGFKIHTERVPEVGTPLYIDVIKYHNNVKQIGIDQYEVLDGYSIRVVIDGKRKQEQLDILRDKISFMMTDIDKSPVSKKINEELYVFLTHRYLLTQREYDALLEQLFIETKLKGESYEN